MIGDNLLLASKSPRRRELLGLIAPGFRTAETHDIEECYPDGLELAKIPEYLSRVKAEAYSHQLKDGEIIITADTVVICGDKVLGKPHSREEATAMLEKLSGKTHTVVTGVTLTSLEKSVTFAETTYVTFDKLTDEQIAWYVDTCHPFDKAGAYGIQEWIGCVGISGIKGCFYNVMGLPLHHLYSALTEF